MSSVMCELRPPETCPRPAVTSVSSQFPLGDADSCPSRHVTSSGPPGPSPALELVVPRRPHGPWAAAQGPCPWGLKKGVWGTAAGDVTTPRGSRGVTLTLAARAGSGDRGRQAGSTARGGRRAGRLGRRLAGLCRRCPWPEAPTAPQHFLFSFFFFFLSINRSENIFSSHFANISFSNR